MATGVLGEGTSMFARYPLVTYPL